MGVAFVVTAAVALGAFFVLGRGSSATGSGSTVVTFTLTSEPSGAEVWRNGARLGTTPYKVMQLPMPGDATFTLKKAGFTDSALIFPGDHDAARDVKLSPAAKTP